DGSLNIWECSVDLDDLEVREEKQQTKQTQEEDASNDKEDENKKEMVRYKRIAKHYFNQEGDFNNLTAVDFHKSSHILVTGFQSGAFYLHELPEFNNIHSLSISDQSIAAVTFNLTGDWIALGCSGLGQLLVWEWQSESYVLKQQGHFNNMTCLDYSPDGQYIVTGGDDSKVKVWNTNNGFCFVTFSEHTAGITGIQFNSNGHVIVSASLDGTVRAFDLHRYRNFRTFTSPRPAQFQCLALDSSSEFVCAGSMDTFEIFVWSMQTGRLLEVLAGHQGPVVSVRFSPTEAILASASWDKSMKLWDVFEHKGVRESFLLNSDALCVAYRPDGREVAVATLNCQITFFDVGTGTQTGSIEGRHDLGSGRRDTDLITAKTASKSKAFTTMCYSADGQCILASGKSKHICIYNIKEQILLKKFEISHNLSLDAMEEFLDRRKMTEFGSVALIDDVDDDEQTVLTLPGVKKGDLSSRSFKPEINVTCVRFSPTGRSWSATTTEGLLVYSLDHSMTFDPYDLTVDVTPDTIRSNLFTKDYSNALMLSFKLNEKNLIEEVVESIPPSEGQCSASQKVCSASQKTCSASQKACSESQKVCSESQKVCSESQKVCSESQKVCSASQKVCSASQKVCSASQKVCSERQEVCSESQKVCSESQKVCPESQKVCSESQKVCSESQKVCSESQKACSESQKACFESQKACSESQEVCSESQKVCSESQKVCPESQKACSESQKACSASQKACSASQKVCSERQEVCSESQKGCSESQKACSESQKVCSESQKGCSESQKACSASQKVCSASQKVCSESQKVCSESQKVCSASQKVCPESQKVCSESQKVCPESQKVCSESQKVCSESQKVNY
uniref:Periodic tryptophan protein 2 homolog n=1 Tax=Saccoglossus kowalevskii TaxID=10224 RepID=A0ABM0M5X9_SACKO